MYFEFLLRRAHSRRRVERRYWSGESLYSRTTCSNSVIVGVMGPMGSGLPQFGFPRRLATKNAFPLKGMKPQHPSNNMILRVAYRIQLGTRALRRQNPTERLIRNAKLIEDWISYSQFAVKVNGNLPPEPELVRANTYK
jgi:hypothetical protein